MEVTPCNPVMPINPYQWVHYEKLGVFDIRCVFFSCKKEGERAAFVLNRNTETWSGIMNLTVDSILCLVSTQLKILSSSQMGEFLAPYTVVTLPCIEVRNT